MQNRKEKNALLGVFIGLGLMSAASLAFGIYMISQGEADKALPVIVSGVICATLIPVIAATTKQKKD